MTAPSVAYIPGEAAGAISGSVWLLVDAKPDDALIETLWDAVNDPDGPTAALDTLNRAGVASIPSFALVASGATAFRVLVRGKAQVDVINGFAEFTLRGDGFSTWAEHLIPDADLVSLRLSLKATSSDNLIPADSGVVLTDAIELRWRATPAMVRKAPSAPPPDVPVASPPPDVVPPELQTAVWRTSTHEAIAAALSAESDGADDEVPAERDAPSDDLAEHQDDDGYDFLFGATTNHTIEDAAVRPSVEETDVEADEWAVPGSRTPPNEDSAPALPPRRPLPSMPPPVAPPPPAVATSEPAPAGFLIGAVPLADASSEPDGAPRPVAPPTPAVAAVSPPADGPVSASAPNLETHTVKRTDLTPGIAAPSVMAVRCNFGHPNPPHAANCRVCGGPIPPQDAALVPRPPLGRLTISTGASVVLDRNVVLGRSPTYHASSDRPHLVKLNNPGGDLSRNHVEIEIDGWHVLVRDLHSTNGTMVTLPGRAPQLLRPEERLPIPPGTRVSLSDDIFFVFEVNG